MFVQALRYAAGRRAGRLLDACATDRAVEALCPHVLLQHPQVQAMRLRSLDHRLSRRCDQPSADTTPLSIVHDVKVFEERTPLRIVVEDDVSEADDGTVVIGDQRDGPGPFTEPVRPGGQSLSAEIPIEVGIGIRAAVVPAPTVGVQRGHSRSITRTGCPNAQPTDPSHVANTPIVPGVGTAPKSVAGPSQGQVPRVTLDESAATLLAVCLPRQPLRGEISLGKRRELSYWAPSRDPDNVEERRLPSAAVSKCTKVLRFYWAEPNPRQVIGTYY